MNFCIFPILSSSPGSSGAVVFNFGSVPFWGSVADGGAMLIRYSTSINNVKRSKEEEAATKK